MNVQSKRKQPLPVIGRRTGVDVKAGKKIGKLADGFEDFDHYWTESEPEDSISVWMREKSVLSSVPPAKKAMRSLSPFTPIDHNDTDRIIQAVHNRLASTDSEQTPSPKPASQNTEDTDHRQPEPTTRSTDTEDATTTSETPGDQGYEASGNLTKATTGGNNTLTKQQLEVLSEIKIEAPDYDDIDTSRIVTDTSGGHPVHIISPNGSIEGGPPKTDEDLVTPELEAQRMESTADRLTQLDHIGNVIGSITKIPSANEAFPPAPQPNSASQNFKTRKRLTYSVESVETTNNTNQSPEKASGTFKAPKPPPKLSGKSRKSSPSKEPLEKKLTRGRKKQLESSENLNVDGKSNQSTKNVSKPSEPEAQPIVQDPGRYIRSPRVTVKQKDPNAIKSNSETSVNSHHSPSNVKSTGVISNTNVKSPSRMSLRSPAKATSVRSKKFVEKPPPSTDSPTGVAFTDPAPSTCSDDEIGDQPSSLVTPAVSNAKANRTIDEVPQSKVTSYDQSEDETTPLLALQTFRKMKDQISDNHKPSPSKQGPSQKNKKNQSPITRSQRSKGQVSQDIQESSGDILTPKRGRAKKAVAKKLLKQKAGAKVPDLHVAAGMKQMRGSATPELEDSSAGELHESPPVELEAPSMGDSSPPELDTPVQEEMNKRPTAKQPRRKNKSPVKPSAELVQEMDGSLENQSHLVNAKEIDVGADDFEVVSESVVVGSRSPPQAVDSKKASITVDTKNNRSLKMRASTLVNRKSSRSKKRHASEVDRKKSSPVSKPRKIKRNSGTTVSGVNFECLPPSLNFNFDEDVGENTSPGDISQMSEQLHVISKKSKNKRGNSLPAIGVMEKTVKGRKRSFSGKILQQKNHSQKFDATHTKAKKQKYSMTETSQSVHQSDRLPAELTALSQETTSQVALGSENQAPENTKPVKTSKKISRNRNQSAEMEIPEPVDREPELTHTTTGHRKAKKRKSILPEPSIPAAENESQESVVSPLTSTNPNGKKGKRNRKKGKVQAAQASHNLSSGKRSSKKQSPDTVSPAPEAISGESLMMEQPCEPAPMSPIVEEKTLSECTISPDLSVIQHLHGLDQEDDAEPTPPTPVHLKGRKKRNSMDHIGQWWGKPIDTNLPKRKSVAIMTPPPSDKKVNTFQETPRSILKRPGSARPSLGTMMGTPLHVYEVTTSNTPQLAPSVPKHNKQVKLIVPDVSEASNLRRSKRTRVKTLDWYRNERIKYSRRKSGGVVIAGVLSEGLEKEEDAVKARRRKLAQLALKKRKPKSKIPSTPRNLSVHETPPEGATVARTSEVCVINPVTREDVVVDCVVTKDQFSFFSATGEAARPDHPILMCKSIKQRAFSVGQLVLRPGQEKGTQTVMNDSMVFVIKQGKVAVTIHRTTSILETDDMFFVPQGNTYSIRNLRKDEAKLWFFQHKG